MIDNKVYLTDEGFLELEEELNELKNVKRPEVIKALKEARALGDLSENADYDAARAEQALVEGRIQELEKIMENVEKFKQIASELGELYEKKNKCYNNSFGDTYEKLGIISAVTRISDKYNRLCNLATNPDIDNLGESIEDTLRDMASYCIMTVMEMQKK